MREFKTNYNKSKFCLKAKIFSMCPGLVLFHSPCESSLSHEMHIYFCVINANAELGTGLLVKSIERNELAEVWNDSKPVFSEV